MIYPPNHFPNLRELEANWHAIRDEYLGVAGETIPWMEKKLYDEGWSVFGLFDFPHGDPIQNQTDKCPTTTRLVKRLFPTHGAVGFSIMAAGTKIRPHVGYAGNFLRCHLGLIIPDGDCQLRVDGEATPWRDGSAFVFDDRVEHEAWNLTNQHRVILLIDFVPVAESVGE